MNTLANLSSWKVLLGVLFTFVFNFTHGEYDFVATLYMKQEDDTTRIGSGSFIRNQNETHPAIIITSKENLEDCIIEDSFIRISTRSINFGIDFWYNNDSVDIGILSLEWNAELFNTSYQNITIADNSTFGYNIPKEGKIIGYNQSIGMITSTDTYLLSAEEVYYINGGKNWANISDQETYGYIDTYEDLISVMNGSSIDCNGLNGAPIVVENNGKFIQYGMLRTHFKIVNQSDKSLFTFNVGPVLVGSNSTWKACALCATSNGENIPACGSCSQGLTDKAVGLTHHIDNDQFLFTFQLNNDSWIYHPEECSVFDILLNTPTNQPTQTPILTDSPTKKPTEKPTTGGATLEPTKRPTSSPIPIPTKKPTGPPIQPPTESPAKSPTASPTESPSPAPTAPPTKNPTQRPTNGPTEEPTPDPTPIPSEGPTRGPTRGPTIRPSASPTLP